LHEVQVCEEDHKDEKGFSALCCCGTVIFLDPWHAWVNMLAWANVGMGLYMYSHLFPNKNGTPNYMVSRFNG
jgi:hypothetical protein